VSDPTLFRRHIVELNTTDNALVRTYVWGQDLSGSMDGAGGVGGLLWLTLHTGAGPAGGTHFCAYDGNGNIVALSAASDGSETARYEYGPFGETIGVTGPAANQNPFRFSTKRTEPTTELALYEYGAFASRTGRWMSRDAVEEHPEGNCDGLVRNAAARMSACRGSACSDAGSSDCSSMHRLRRDSQKATANKGAHFVAAIPVKAESACDAWRRTKDETDCSLCCEEVYAKYANRCSWRKKLGWLAWRNACLSRCAKSDGEQGPDLPGPNRVPPILP
jgi:RHS repeat-associated protein